MFPIETCIFLKRRYSSLTGEIKKTKVILNIFLGVNKLSWLKRLVTSRKEVWSGSEYPTGLKREGKSLMPESYEKKTQRGILRVLKRAPMARRVNILVGIRAGR